MRKVSNAQPRIYLRLLRNKVGLRWQPNMSVHRVTELGNLNLSIWGLEYNAVCPHNGAMEPPGLILTTDTWYSCCWVFIWPVSHSISLHSCILVPECFRAEEIEDLKVWIFQPHSALHLCSCMFLPPTRITARCTAPTGESLSSSFLLKQHPPEEG